MRPQALFAFLLAFLLIPRQVEGGQASTAAPNPAPASSTRGADDSYAKEPYVFELLENNVRFEADGRGQRDFTLRARIQSESAVREFGLLTYPFASSFESLDVVYVRVRKPDGTVVETPLTDVQELDAAVSREAPMYTDQREKHIAVKSLSVGDVLEARLHWSVHDPIAPGHFWFDDSPFRAGICLQEIVRIDVPVNVAVKVAKSDLQPEVREEGGRRIYTFKSANLKKPEESKIPEWEKDFHGAPPPPMQVSSFASWQEVGRWFDGLAQPKASVTPEIRAKAEELTKGKTTEDEKLHAIYDFVSTRFRYIGIDLGMGRYTPHSSADVLVNRYGDCKDKHTLFASLLQAVGIKAYPALISSRFRIDPDFPAVSLFDHVITAIPKGDSFVFLDTTPEVAPYGLLLANLRDRDALVIPDEGAARLMRTPADPPFPSYEHAKIEAVIDTKGTLDAKMRIEDRGDGELALRLAYRSVPQNKWEELTQNIMARMGFAGKVSAVSVAQPEDTSQPFWMSFSYHRTDYPDWKNHRVVLIAPPVFLPDLSEEQKLSKDSLPLGALQDVTYDATMKFPKGFTPIVPEKVEQKSDFADYSMEYTLENGALHGIIHLKTLLHELPGSERSLYSSVVKNIDETSRRYIFIQGDFGDGPAVPSGLNAMITKPELAIPMLEKKLADDPDNAALLLLLSRDYYRVGRAKDAVTLLENALAKNPEADSRLNFALGEAYLKLSEGEKAFAQYKKALGDAPEPLQLNNVAYELAEASVHLPEALDYSKRAVASISEKTRDISSDDAQVSDFALMPQLAGNWDTLGWIKFRMGDITGAQKYLEAAWQLMQEAIVGEHLVEVYEKLGKKQNAALLAIMARAALDNRPRGPDSDIEKRLNQEVERLRPFLKSSAAATSALGRPVQPDGHVSLVDMRSMHIPMSGKMRGDAGNATFLISITNGPKVDDVVFLSGAEELRNAIAALSAAKYPQSFPDETPARILRKANVNYSKYTKESLLVFTPVEDAAIPTNVPFNIITPPQN